MREARSFDFGDSKLQMKSGVLTVFAHLACRWGPVDGAHPPFPSVVY